MIFISASFSRNSQTSQDRGDQIQSFNRRIILEESADFEAAKASAVEFQKKIFKYRIEELDKVLLRYTIYAQVKGITAKLTFLLSLEADLTQPDFYHAHINLSEVSGKGAMDKILVSLGKVFGKVPDTRKKFRTEMMLDENSHFRTLRFWELPHKNFIKEWIKILKKRKRILEYKKKKDQSEKARKLEEEIQKQKSCLWSPILIEFAKDPKRVIRYKKNNVDKEAKWEDETIYYSTQVDFFTALLNYFIMGMDHATVIPVVYISKELDGSEEGMIKPRYMFGELKMHMLPIHGKESNEYYPCNMRLDIKEAEKLVRHFSNPIYFRRELVETNNLFFERISNIPSYIYIGDIIDINGEKKTLLATKIRLYLADTLIIQRGHRRKAS